MAGSHPSAISYGDVLKLRVSDCVREPLTNGGVPDHTGDATRARLPLVTALTFRFIVAPGRESGPETQVDRRAFMVATGVGVSGCATRKSAATVGMAAPACRPNGNRVTFVLVHGAWVGGWCWGKVADILRAEGHKVYAPSLTGLADRSHLLTPSVSLSTHVDDIANLIWWEELTDIVLVGHSYGGMVISGVAERVREGAIHSIVYLDAMYTDDGTCIVDHFPNFEGVIGSDDPVPVLPADAWGYDAEMAAWADKLQTPHPRRTFYDTLRITGARDRVPIKTFVVATQNVDSDGLPTFRKMAKAATSKPGWRYEELACQHDTMLFLPNDTALMLLRAAAPR